MTEVTPRPWHYDAAEYEIRSNDSERHTIGRFHAGRHDDGNRAVPRKADAELIVKAVNAHDALVNAATQIVAEFDEWGSVLQVGYDDDMGEYGPTSAIEQLRTALEAAK